VADSSLVGDMTAHCKPAQAPTPTFNTSSTGTPLGFFFIARSTRQSRAAISRLRKSRSKGGLASSFCTFCPMRMAWLSLRLLSGFLSRA
jgi:hypothetical protein